MHAMFRPDIGFMVLEVWMDTDSTDTDTHTHTHTHTHENTKHNWTELESTKKAHLNGEE